MKHKHNTNTTRYVRNTPSHKSKHVIVQHQSHHKLLLSPHGKPTTRFTIHVSQLPVHSTPKHVQMGNLLSSHLTRGIVRLPQHSVSPSCAGSPDSNPALTNPNALTSVYGCTFGLGTQGLWSVYTVTGEELDPTHTTKCCSASSMAKVSFSIVE